jgi:hypothetical protein
MFNLGNETDGLGPSSGFWKTTKQMAAVALQESISTFYEKIIKERRCLRVLPFKIKKAAEKVYSSQVRVQILKR